MPGANPPEPSQIGTQMARRVFFSFEYSDVQRAMVVRNSWVTVGRQAAGFIDAADFEAVKKRGDAAIKSWIDGQLVGTTVTCVLVGAETCQSKWVQYEIDASIARGNAMLGIDISKIKAFDGSTTDRCGKIPAGYPFHLWNTDDGPKNLGTWIDNAPV
ncbi:MAG: TIR domain-containing protein [Acidimicrobiales bacterium]